MWRLRGGWELDVVAFQAWLSVIFKATPEGFLARAVGSPRAQNIALS